QVICDVSPQWPQNRYGCQPPVNRYNRGRCVPTNFGSKCWVGNIFFLKIWKFMKQLQDRFGRVHNAMRISVTDKCNLRCHYCMPVTGVECAPRERLLTFEQIVQTVQVAN